MMDMAYLCAPEGSQNHLKSSLQEEENQPSLDACWRNLGIISITSLSPQAKGRIERLWVTFQDRLTSELRIAGATNSREANLVLWDFLLRFTKGLLFQPQSLALPTVQFLIAVTLTRYFASNTSVL